MHLITVFSSVRWQPTTFTVYCPFNLKCPCSLLGGGQLLLRQLDTLGGNHLPIYRRPTDPKMPDY